MKVQDLLKDVLDKCISVDNKEEMLSYLRMEENLSEKYNRFIIGWYEYKNIIYILCNDKTGSDLRIYTRHYGYIKNYDDIKGILWELNIGANTFSTVFDMALPSLLTEKIITILPEELKIDFKKAIDDYIKKTYEGMSYDDYVKSKKDKIQQSIDFISDLLNHYNSREERDLSLRYVCGDKYYDDADAKDYLKDSSSIRFTYKNREFFLNKYKDYNGIIYDDLFLFSIKSFVKVNTDIITIETELKEQTVDGLIKTINDFLTKEQAVIKCLSK